MGRICPILNHPLNDGVLIEDDALISFIQKRNVDFLAQELVCRSCKHEVTKLYNKKLKKAIELHRSRYHEGSISSLKTSKNSTSSGASTTSEKSASLRESRQKGQVEEITHNVIVSRVYDLTKQQQYGNETLASGDSNQNSSSKAVRAKSVEPPIHYNNENENSILQENQRNLANTQDSTAVISNGADANNFKNVTLRKKKTIKDFLTPKQKEMTPQRASINTAEAITQRVHNKTKGILQTISPVRKKSVVQHVTYDTELEIRETTTPAKRTSNVSTNTNSKPTTTVQVNTKASPKSTNPTVRFDINDNNDDDVNRRMSQEPTTSKTAASSMANSNKRPISAIIEDNDEDNQPLSLYAFNGTRLPHVQPLPPKRKSQPDQPRPIVHDIMDNYIRDITGG